MIDPKTLTIEEASRRLKQSDFSVRDLTEACLKNIEKENKKLNVFLEVFDVEGDIKRAEEMFDSKKDGLLTGIPIAIKDNILIKGKTCSAASKILENYKASYDATVIKKLKEAGVIIIGRTNMDEFAMGSSTENSAYGITKNPLDPSRVPGGSSGGSAAAVSSGMALGALGSDTGGSIRQPAAFCGITGMLPTYGAVSRYGLIAMASSLDQIGPLAKTSRDAEIIYDAISGHDLMDSTSYNGVSHHFHKKPKAIGVPREFLIGLNKEVSVAFEESLNKLKNSGYEIIDIDLPYLKYALPIYYIIMPAEASTNLARYEGMRFGPRLGGRGIRESFIKTRMLFGSEVKRRIMLGTFVLSHGYRDAYYNQAIKLRGVIKMEFCEMLKKVDVIAMPTTPEPAFKIGAKADPLSMYLSDIFTVSANIANLPALAISNLQFIGPAFSEKMLFAIGESSA